MHSAARISYTPPWLAGTELVRSELVSPSGDMRWTCSTPRGEGWTVVEAGLRKAAAALGEMPVAAIIAAIDRVACAWTDRTFAARRASVIDVVAATGFSAEAVERSFDVELRNYRAEYLHAVLRRELGTPEMLDRFVPDTELPGLTRAFGPKIAVAVLTGNVPGLPALAMVRALLVKSAVIAKVASGEPTFAAAFARTLAESDARIGDAILVTYWPHSDRTTLDAALGCADVATVYGGEDACKAVREAMPPGKPLFEHGHKLSAGVVTRAYRSQVGDAELARRIAVDVGTFNQHACIAPQAYVLEATPDEARSFMRVLAQAFERYADACPLGEPPEDDAAALQLRRAALAWDAATDADGDLLHAPGLDWTLALHRSLAGEGGSGNRVLRLVAVPTAEAALDALAAYGRYLQNVALAATQEELLRLAERLAAMGACRLSEPGRMAEPSMMWRHDGRLCVAELLRFCDIEMHAGAALERGSPTDGRSRDRGSKA
jgi:hypothetical protein